jgi:hypothetical protein
MVVPKRRTLAPAITRVHKLFRIRTIVNESPKYVQPKAQGVNTEQIARILVDRKLSKQSILESQNKLKRARDHALNASILGFFVPIPQDHQFLYAKSIIADELAKYTLDQECPSDLHESAVFIDRMMKLKLTNAYDSRHTYSEFHTRPFLSILTMLKHQRLHISQIHYLMAQTKDLTTHPSLLRTLFDTFGKYPSHDEKSIPRFMRDFKLSNKLTAKEIGRSTKPLLDWMRQGGLLILGDDNWASITENGLEVQKYYSQYLPMWYDRLPFNAALSAAILTVYNYGLLKGLRIDRKRLDGDARDTLEELQSEFGIWDSSYSHLKNRIDFDVNYDVPYELRQDTISHSNRLAKDLGWQTINNNEISTFSIAEIQQILTTTSSEQKQLQLGRALGIDIPRQECFQTEFEWEVCVRLRVLQYPAYPYQGEFEGETDLPMATANPDIVIKNAVRVLVECKSRNEWGNIVKYDKRVGGELLMYQTYAEEVNANSAVFVCDVDRFDSDAFVTPFVKQSDRLNKISLVIWSYLGRIQKDRTLMDKFNKLVSNPRLVKPAERIVCS